MNLYRLGLGYNYDSDFVFHANINETDFLYKYIYK